MTPNAALRTLQATDAASARRAWAVAGMMKIARGYHRDGPSAESALGSESFAPDLPPIVFVPDFAFVFQVSLFAAEQFLTALAQSVVRPCGFPLAEGVYDSISEDVSLTSKVLVRRRLREVAPLLDPRRWDETGGLFRRTCAVECPPGPEPRCLERATGAGDRRRWDGIIYERAAVGPCETENLLSVIYDRGTSRRRTVRVDFRLYRSLSQRFGGWEAPGVFRRDSGWLTAKPAKCDDSDRRANCTEIQVKKTIRYGRMSTWSGSSLVDYGELSNYLAPAFLTLWVSNIQLVVPCGVDGATAAAV